MLKSQLMLRTTKSKFITALKAPVALDIMSCSARLTTTAHNSSQPLKVHRLGSKAHTSMKSSCKLMASISRSTLWDMIMLTPKQENAPRLTEK
jgi:hypothetical protein